MSFRHTTCQVVARSKRVTRRLGWWKLSTGTQLQAVEKNQGLRKGESVVKLAVIRVVSVRPEPLSEIENEPDGCALEGFPEMSPAEFIAMFCQHMGGDAGQLVNRIEFEYLV